MPRTSGKSPPERHGPAPRAASPVVAVVAVVVAALLGCTTRDAVVGKVLAGGEPDGAVAPALASDFARDDGAWNLVTHLPGADITFGSPAAGAVDDRAVVLRLPGAVTGDPATFAGPAFATEIDSVAFLRFGTLRARIQFPTCDPGEEVAAAMFWFYNDGQDRNGDGITDNPEIDLHVLCGTPTFLVLTAWSDYQVAPDGSEAFRRVSRAVDLATGDLYDGVSDHERAYAKTGQSAVLARPDFAPTAGFVEVGIEWRTDGIRFFATFAGVETTLWQMNEARFIPQVPLQFCFNLWHPATHWLPPAGPARYPAADARLAIDGFGYWPAE
jgi:hypothetical protein